MTNEPSSATATSGLLTEDDCDWLAVSAGRLFACGLRGSGPTGTLWCWGENSGAFGSGNLDDSIEPIQVNNDTDWIAIACGDEFSCGVKVDGSVYCWGWNDGGQTGTFGAANGKDRTDSGVLALYLDAIGPDFVLAVDVQQPQQETRQRN